MFSKNDSLLKWIDISPKCDLKGTIGIEKESLRIFDGNISQKPHSEYLGSSLCNQFITTDFAEAQIELVTPPFSENAKLFNFLENIQHFVFHNIGDEYLWPFSIPPHNKDQKEASIANFGKSNKAVFKHLYRNGLAERYGKDMQTISGIHINFSHSNTFWNSIKVNYSQKNIERLKSEIYFRAIRNIERCNWLLLYLFGTSPILCKNLINYDHNFVNITDEEYYLPYATSLRMSSMGYQNIGQSKLNVSLDNLEGYLADLKSATETVSNEFIKFDSDEEMLKQLNPNLLQIEDEYYGISRPKSSDPTDIRQIKKLSKFGIDYLELRSLDLNPFSLHGIEKKDLDFIELFIIYCTITPSPIIEKIERENINKNNRLISIEGRKDRSKLIRNGKKILLCDWASEIIEQMEEFSEIFGFKGFNKQEYLSKTRTPETTLSAKVLNEAKGQGFHNLGESLAKKNQLRYKKIPETENKDWQLFEDEKRRSLIEQYELDNQNSISFSDYLDNFYK
tara:strand:- start:61923 stop:63446 length:1524 start_codon:yes stop_codon:yes gene_type:complete